MGRNEDLLAGDRGEVAETVQKLLLQGGVQMGVGLIEEQEVKVGVRREREDAQPLQESAALDHQVAVSVPGVPLQLVAVDRSLDDLDLDVGVVLLAERSHDEFSAERGPEVLLQELVRVGCAKSTQVRVGDLGAVATKPKAFGHVAPLHVEQDVA